MSQSRPAQAIMRKWLWQGVACEARICTLGPSFLYIHGQGQRHGCVRCRYVVQRRTRVAEGGDAAILDRSADRGLGAGATRVPAGVRDQSVGAGQRPSRLPGQAGEMGRWERQARTSCVQMLHTSHTLYCLVFYGSAPVLNLMQV